MEVNKIPEDVKLDPRFLKFLQKLHVQGFAAHRNAISQRKDSILRAFDDRLPNYPSENKLPKWKAPLPEWMKDQRNQMTGPADNEELVVKLINSGSPGVMLDIEDSMANQPENLLSAHDIVKRALYGQASYVKKGKTIVADPSKTVTFLRVRGLHLTQVYPGFVRTNEETSASLFDLAMHFYDLDLDKLPHAPCIYVPKSESAREGKWWAQTFSKIERMKNWPQGTIKCMALVEAHPLAYEMDQFAFNLQPYLVGLNLGRWDYMASLIDYMYYQKGWLFPDRNSIPSDIPFFQNLRKHMVNVCHEHGMLAIGGMSAMYPSRSDADFNKVAQEKLKADKDNEAAMGMDGAWTGHPDQNEIAVGAFPEPNQLDRLHEVTTARPPDLREFPNDGLPITEEGTKEAIRVCTQYRQGVLDGKGASLINGFMEDLATDRIYRIIVCQRLDRGVHSIEQIEGMFGEIVKELGEEFSDGAEATLELIKTRQFNPK